MKEQKKMSKKALLLTALAAVLVAVGLLAILLANPEKRAEKALEKTTEACKMLLKKESYEELPELYASVSKYPQCQTEIERQLTRHVEKAMLDCNEKRIPKVYYAFAQEDVLFDVVYAAIMEGAEKLYADSYIDFMIFHQALTAEQFFLQDLDQYVLDYVREQVEKKDYTFASTYIRIVYHCETCLSWLQQYHEDQMAAYLEQGQYEDASLLYSHMEYVELKDDRIGAMWRDRAYELMDEGKYVDAQYLLYELRDQHHQVYDLDAQFTLRLATLYVYIEAGDLARAREWAESFAGQTREKLLEVLEKYTG